MIDAIIVSAVLTMATVFNVTEVEKVRAGEEAACAHEREVFETLYGVPYTYCTQEEYLDALAGGDIAAREKDLMSIVFPPEFRSVERVEDECPC